jgi:hypothetical protein
VQALTRMIMCDLCSALTPKSEVSSNYLKQQAVFGSMKELEP